MYRIGPNDCSLSPNANGGREVPIISLMMLRTSDVILGQWEWKKLKRHLSKCVIGREFPNTFQRLTFKFCKIAIVFILCHVPSSAGPEPSSHPPRDSTRSPLPLLIRRLRRHNCRNFKDPQFLKLNTKNYTNT